jgi:hypothetical protein
MVSCVAIGFGSGQPTNSSRGGKPSLREHTRRPVGTSTKVARMICAESRCGAAGNHRARGGRRHRPWVGAERHRRHWIRRCRTRSSSVVATGRSRCRRNGPDCTSNARSFASIESPDKPRAESAQPNAKCHLAAVGVRVKRLRESNEGQRDYPAQRVRAENGIPVTGRVITLASCRVDGLNGVTNDSSPRVATVEPQRQTIQLSRTLR